MDAIKIESVDIKTENVIIIEVMEIKAEPLSSDSEFDFEFKLDKDEYEEVIKSIRANDSDLEEVAAKKKFQCPDCPKKFCARRNLIRHQRFHDPELMKKHAQICHICGKVINGNLSNHLRSHLNRKPHDLFCDICDKAFRNHHAVATHKQRAHENKKHPLTCDYCGHICESLQDFREHVKTHIGDKPYSCEYCDKTYASLRSRNEHALKHTHVREFLCNLCGKEYLDENTYQKHTLKHSNPKKHQCLVCYMSFNHAPSLIRHSKKLHKHIFQCHLCSESFRFQSFLKRHITMQHKGEMPKLANQMLMEEVVSDGYEEVVEPDANVMYYQSIQ